MKRLLRKIHRFYFMGLLFLFFIILYPWLWLVAQHAEKHYSQLMRMRRWMVVSASALAGFRFKLEGGENIDWNRAYLICANHTSNLDIIALIVACKQDFSFMGKEELKENPITGLFFKTIDIPVNRSSKISSFRAYSKAKQLLEEDRSIMIFPEGGIYDCYPPVIQPFKNGAFKLAIDLGVPVLPVVIHDSWKIFWDDGKTHGTKPGVCHVSIHEPIDAHKLSIGVDALRDTAFQVFQQSLNSKNE